MSEEKVVALVLVPAEEAGSVARAMAADGFEVGPYLGIAMAISAPRDTFERVFGTPVEAAPDGGWMAEGRRELPLRRLPPDLASRIQAVTFDEPAEPVP
jgi:hypothetical protein